MGIYTVWSVTTSTCCLETLITLADKRGGFLPRYRVRSVRTISMLYVTSLTHTIWMIATLLFLAYPFVCLCVLSLQHSCSGVSLSNQAMRGEKARLQPFFLSLRMSQSADATKRVEHAAEQVRLSLQTRHRSIACSKFATLLDTSNTRYLGRRTKDVVDMIKQDVLSEQQELDLDQELDVSISTSD